MLTSSDWQKMFRFQKESGWCGPAVIEMALLSGGIEKEQKDIAKDVYDDWWGTSQQAILAYLSRFFKKLNFKENAGLLDLESHLKAGHVIIVNWWDDIDPEDAEGHYSLVIDYDSKDSKIILGDPSSRRGIWKIDSKEFESKWYDFLDEPKKIIIKKWMLWVDPSSKV